MYKIIRLYYIAMLRATDSCIILLCRTNLVLEYSFPFASMNVSTCFEWYFACFLSIIDVIIYV